MLRVRTSRRVAGLKPADYDHAIDLVNHDESQPSRPPSLAAGRSTASSATPSTLLANETEPRPAADDLAAEESTHIPSGKHHKPVGEPRSAGPSREHNKPLIEVQAPTPDVFYPHGPYRIVPKRPRETRETAIDIMYENERGLFMCGTGLFSSKALGGLDPPAWSTYTPPNAAAGPAVHMRLTVRAANAYHKASPTSIYTAQVPDPSWEWVWPEWRVNHQDGMDQGGWEYSFAFSKKLSWHGPKWWNSFVRRRAWIRKRAKKKLQDSTTDPYTLNSDYFVIHSSSHRSRLSNGSFGSSRVPSRSNLSQLSKSDKDESAVVMSDIENMETLLRTLRLARIDREKREAVENYLDHGTDLPTLQEEMHEIMSLFIFQASRKQLLGRLMREHNETVQRLETKGDGNDAALQERKSALDAAVKHAGEEVRKLAFWSDVKQMAKNGELRDSFDSEQGWYDANQDLDRRGPMRPNKGKLPTS